MKNLVLALVAAFAISAPAFADQNEGEAHEGDSAAVTETHEDMGMNKEEHKEAHKGMHHKAKKEAVAKKAMQKHAPKKAMRKRNKTDA